MDPKSAVGGPKPISRTGRDSAKNIDYRPTPKKHDISWVHCTMTSLMI